MRRRNAVGFGAPRRRGGVLVMRWEGDGAEVVLTTALVSRARPSATTPAKVFVRARAAPPPAGQQQRRFCAVVGGGGLVYGSGRSRATVSTVSRGHAHAHELTRTSVVVRCRRYNYVSAMWRPEGYGGRVEQMVCGFAVGSTIPDMCFPQFMLYT